MNAERTPVAGPAYLRIADDFRIAIEDGLLVPGAALPSLAEIADQYGVSTAVARQAVTVLKGQALIATGQGKRPTVRVGRPKITRSNRQHQEAKDRVSAPEGERRANGALEDTTGISVHDVRFTAEYTRVTADESAPQFDAGTPLLRREYRTLDERGRLLAWSVSWLPVELLEPNPALLDSSNEPWPGGTQHQLHTVGIEVAEFVDTITARAPTTVEAQQWDMSPGEPLFVTSDVLRDTNGRVVSTSTAQYPADTTQFEFTTPLRKARRAGRKDS